MHVVTPRAQVVPHMRDKEACQLDLALVRSGRLLVVDIPNAK